MQFLSIMKNTPAESGEFTDTRDGQKYRTVKIGNQIWMAENLNFKIDGSWCYDDDEANGKIYGRLYNWEAAKMACPAGWHLPSDDEWEVLVNAVGGRGVDGKHLKSKTGWYPSNWDKIECLDTYGFSALPGGARGLDGSFFNAGGFGYWWTATGYDAGNAYNRLLCASYYIVGGGYYRVSIGFSVRCVRD
jgi:uncharacterized protein (TIGR02145 family)